MYDMIYSACESFSKTKLFVIPIYEETAITRDTYELTKLYRY